MAIETTDDILLERAGRRINRSASELQELIEDRVAGLLVAGANVTLTYNDAAGTLTIAASGGGGGSGNAVAAQVDFGAFSDYAEATVAAVWAAAGTKIAITPALPTTADHDAEDAIIEGLSAGLVAINPGVGFTIGVNAPNGTWGRYDFNCIGV